jgi:DNA-directed RNA polymerase specialized sigma24 family protein
MKAGLTAETFSRLLDRLDVDRDRAAERYEDYRRTLTRFFEWRGAPFPEEHTDETFDRVARRLDEGIEITNLGGYCHEVARLVFLEALKGPDRRRTQLGAINVEAAVPMTDVAEEKEARLSCLESCLAGLTQESRELIVEYYQDERRGRIDRRKALADRLGLQREALANRAQRVRDKLQRCVAQCMKNKPSI